MPSAPAPPSPGPARPELNPVERLWLAVRQAVDVFDEAVQTTLDGLREHTAEVVRSLTPERVASLTGYDYILGALDALQS